MNCTDKKFFRTDILKKCTDIRKIHTDILRGAHKIARIACNDTDSMH